MFNVTTVLPHSLLQTNPCLSHKSSESARHNFTMWGLSCATFSDLHFLASFGGQGGQKM